MDGVAQWFAQHPRLAAGDQPIIHSVKARLKNCDHLRDKLHRKWEDSDPINGSNVFERVTDLAGTRQFCTYIKNSSATIARRRSSQKLKRLRTRIYQRHPEEAYAYGTPSQGNSSSGSGLALKSKTVFHTSLHVPKQQGGPPICCELASAYAPIQGNVGRSRPHDQLSQSQ